MVTLYYTPGTCSMAVHAVLNELGQDVALEAVDIRNKAAQSAEFKAINPRGNVPVLVDDGKVIREGAAILIHLAEKHRSQLLPQGGEARIDALQWLMFANATLHPAYGRVFFLKGAAPDGDVKTALLKAACDAIQRAWDEVEAHLQSHEYLAGAEPTLADFLITVIANWSENLPEPVRLGARTKALFSRIKARPSFQKTLSQEGVEYKVAA